MFPGLVSRLSVKSKTAAATLDADADVIVLTGTTAIVTLNPKVSNRSNQSQFVVLIPTGGAVATTTAGNIAVVQSMANNQATLFVWAPSTAKWYPHALA